MTPVHTLRIIAIIAAILIGFNAYADKADIETIAQLRETADSLHNAGRADSAAIVMEQAIQLAERTGIPAQIIGTNAAQGVFLRSMGQIEAALSHYEKALEIASSETFRSNPDNEDIEEAATLYINMAILNLDMGHKDEAAAYAIRSAEWISRSDDPAFKGEIYGAVGSVLTGTRHLEEAMDYHRMSYENTLAAGNKEAAFRAAAYTMLTSAHLGDSEAEKEWCKRCIDMLPDIQSAMGRLAYYQAECSICLRQGREADAIVYFKKILDLDGIDAYPFVMLDCYNNMHLSYAATGDYSEAYTTLLKATELRDSIYQHDKAESMRDLTVKYETKETELALAKSENRRAMILVWLLAAAALLLVLAIAFVVYASRQRRNRMAREMEFANLRADLGRQLTEQYVEGLESERERMARELHDGVCNDLMAIQMNINNGKPASDTARMINTCRESVRRISHELMPPEFAYATLDEVMRYHINKLSGNGTPEHDIAYSSSSDMSWDAVPDNISLEVYRIAQEAIGNALKHSKDAAITVTMTMKNNTLSLTVADNGTVAKTDSSRGIGLKSMNRRAAAIKGKIDTYTSADGSFTVNLSVRL